MLRLSLWIAWAFAIVYASIPAFWFFVHPLAAFWRKRSFHPFLVLVPVWLLVMGLLAVVTLFGVELRLYETAWTWLMAAILVAGAIRVYRQAGDFGGARLIGLAEMQPQKHEQRLVTTGMHARVRHPFYLAHFLMLTSWTVAAGSVATILLWLFGVLAGAVMIALEDRELERRFGADYREYRRRVPAIIPRLRN